MGTPDIAATILSALYDSGFDIRAVFTTPDKPRGRGHRLTPTPVKSLALERGSSVYTPVSLRSDEVTDILSSLSPDVIVVAAYGKILPAGVLNLPRFGCINVHASLLPKYRGAAPIQRAIIDGEEVTGVTIMKMDEGLDTGDMLSKASVPILPTDNFESVHDALAAAGAQLLVETLPQFIAGEITPEKQKEEGSSYAEKIEQEDRVLDFRNNAREIINRIRGLSPIPLAMATHKEKTLKITSALPEIFEKSGECGTVTAVSDKGEGYIEISCADGNIRITGVVPEGRGKQSAGDFVRGRGICPGERLE